MFTVKKVRNAYGRITSRRGWWPQKTLSGKLIFGESKLINLPKFSLEYDPNRTAHLALLEFEDGTKTYILAPTSVSVGDILLSSNQKIDFKPGNALPSKFNPTRTKVHCVEMLPGAGAKLARSAGCEVRLISVDGNHASLKMPSGEIRLVKEIAEPQLVRLAILHTKKSTIGKAGRNRWKGRQAKSSWRSDESC